MTQEREMIELLLHEFGDHHYHGCPADHVPEGECNCYAGALNNKARALLAASAPTIADTAGAKPVAWKVVWPNGIYDLFAYEQDAVADAEMHRGTIIPLYASPAIDVAPCVVHPITANYVLSDKREACSSCGLTMGESTLLRAIKQDAENRPAIDAAGASSDDVRAIERRALERAYAAAYKADTMACNAIRALIDELNAKESGK